CLSSNNPCVSWLSAMSTLVATENPQITSSPILAEAAIATGVSTASSIAYSVPALLRALACSCGVGALRSLLTMLFAACWVPGDGEPPGAKRPLGSLSDVG